MERSFSRCQILAFLSESEFRLFQSPKSETNVYQCEQATALRLSLHYVLPGTPFLPNLRSCFRMEDCTKLCRTSFAAARRHLA